MQYMYLCVIINFQLHAAHCIVTRTKLINLRVALDGIVRLDARKVAAPIVVLVDDYAEVQHVEWVLGWQVRIINAGIFKAEFVGVVIDPGSIDAGNALEVVASRTAEALADGTSTEIDLVFLEDRAEDGCVFLGVEGGRGGDGWSGRHFWSFVRLGDLNGWTID